MVTHQTNSPKAALPLRCAESLRLSVRTGRKPHFYSGLLWRKGLAFPRSRRRSRCGAVTIFCSSH